MIDVAIGREVRCEMRARRLANREPVRRDTRWLRSKAEPGVGSHLVYFAARINAGNQNAGVSFSLFGRTNPDISAEHLHVDRQIGSRGH